MAIISLSGKMRCGKDTVGIIIQYLTCTHKKHYAFEEWLDRKENYNSSITSIWQIKKFADKLKDIACLLINCTREELEDAEFKNKELGEEWWSYEHPLEGKLSYLELKHFKFLTIPLIKPTPRLMLQNIGTDLFRNQLHPNIWVNSLMNEYKPLVSVSFAIMDLGMSNLQLEKKGQTIPIEYPNWIITDTRFPNELEAVKQRNGITIRVNRNNGTRAIDINPHESEKALDNAKFDYIIENNSTLEELIHNVKNILIQEKII